MSILETVRFGSASLVCQRDLVVLAHFQAGRIGSGVGRRRVGVYDRTELAAGWLVLFLCQGYSDSGWVSLGLNLDLNRMFTWAPLYLILKATVASPLRSTRPSAPTLSIKSSSGLSSISTAVTSRRFTNPSPFRVCHGNVSQVNRTHASGEFLGRFDVNVQVAVGNLQRDLSALTRPFLVFVLCRLYRRISPCRRWQRTPAR